MTYTINLSQINTYLVFVLPFIVAFVAGVLRQDGFEKTRYEWINEFIFHAVLLGLAAAQTLLGGNLGGSGLANFLFAVVASYALLDTKFGKSLLQNIQTPTSLMKAPPAPPALTLESIAAVIAQQLQAYNVQNKPIDQQQTQAYQVMRSNTPPLGG